MPSIGGRRSGRQLSFVASRGRPATRWGSSQQFVRRLASRYTRRGGYSVVPGPGTLDADRTAQADLASVAVAAAGASLAITVGAGLASVTVAAQWGASYSATVLADTPYLWYRLGESAGTTATDSSGNSRDGTYTGTYTLGTAGLLTGDSDTAVAFNSGYVITKANVTGFGNAAWTLEAWIKGTSSANGDVVWIGGDATNTGANLRINTSGHIACVAGTLSHDFGGANLADGAVHHVLMTYDGAGTMKAWADGSQYGSDWSCGTLAIATGLAYVACLNFYYIGTVDEAAIYSTALTSTRISAHYTAGMTGGSTVGTTAIIAPNAGLASTAVAAYDVPFAAATIAYAELAAVAVAAYAPAVSVNPNAGLVTVAVAAYAGGAKTTPNAGLASVAVAGYAAVLSVKPNAGLASVAVAAYAVPMCYAQAGLTAVAVAAGSATASVTAVAGLAAVAVAAAGASLAITVGAGLASVTVASPSATPSLAPSGGLAAVTVAAYDVPFGTETIAPAGLASVAVAAYVGAVGVAPSAGIGAVSVAAYDVPFGAVTVAYAGLASVAVTGRSPQAITEGGRRAHMPVALPDQSVVARSLYDDLKKRYGDTKGLEVYLNMAQERKGPFGAGKKYDRGPE